MRNIVDVIAQLAAVLPEGDCLLADMNSIKSSASFTAPEAVGLLWQRLQQALICRFATSHAEGEETELIAKTMAIFNGTN